MAKRIKKAEQEHALESVLYHLRRAQRYVAREDVAVCLKRRTATTAIDYVRADGAALTEINKEIGSDICGLEFAERELVRLLTPRPIAHPYAYRIERLDGSIDGLGDEVLFEEYDVAFDAVVNAFKGDPASDGPNGVWGWLRIVKVQP